MWLSTMQAVRPWPWTWLLLLLTVQWAISEYAPAATPNQNPPATRQQREVELGRLRQRIERLQARLKEAQGQQSELSGQLRESEQQIGQLARGLRVSAGRIERLQRRLTSLQQQEQQQQAALAEEKRILAKQVRAAYAMGRQEQLRILLNQQDLGETSRMLAYFDYLNQERAQRMRRIREQLKELAQTRSDIEAQQQKLARIRQHQQDQKLALERQQSARRKVLQRLSAEVRGQDRQLDSLRNDEKQLLALLRGLRDALADIPAEAESRKQQPFANKRGQLDWPVRGMIRHAFGETKIGKLRWDGVMIGAPEGREVRAVSAGRVAFADWLRGFGLLLIIDHGEGFMTLYGHNQSLFKEAGDWVEAGEPIASVGSTGGRKESGVYFAIRRHGKVIDPRKWCRRTKGRSVG